jgi:transaldolase/glucose-6-phosphate isomerase
VWLDNLHRGMLAGDLGKLIADGLRGMTSNPSIFEKSIGHSDAYAEQLRSIDKKVDDEAAYEQLAIADIQGACDAFRPLYDRTHGRDGFVSLEVSPRLARDTAGTIAAARRLHAAVARPNVMIKIPGTHEGVPAIEATIAAGIHVNTTLLFGVDAYLAAADAYMAGLEQLRARGGNVAQVAGVASFFLSRIDTAVDKLLPDGDKLRGTAAVANAKVAYAAYQGMIASPRWQSLARSGAQPQRLLWASTSTKNPAYDKLLYVAPLVGRDTVNTMPDETLAELRERGTGRLKDGAITADLDAATRQLADIAGKGVSLRAVTDKLLDEGVAAFAKSFDSLLAAVASKRKA